MSVATGSLSSERRGAFGRIHQRIGTAGMVSAGFVLVVAVLAILAPVASPYSPNAIDLLSINAGPSAAHLLGIKDHQIGEPAGRIALVERNIRLGDRKMN